MRLLILEIIFYYIIIATHMSTHKESSIEPRDAFYNFGKNKIMEFRSLTLCLKINSPHIKKEIDDIVKEVDKLEEYIEGNCHI